MKIFIKYRFLSAVWLVLSTGLFWLLPINNLQAQSGNMIYERVWLEDERHMLCRIECTPDGKYLDITSTQGYPLYRFDYGNKKVVSKWDVGNWYAGSAIGHSATGKYILLEQLYYIDWRLNKDKKVNYELLDGATGKRVLRLEEYHSVDISRDEKTLIALAGNHIDVFDLSTLTKVRSIDVPRITNAAAISPDGTQIAVSMSPDPKVAKNLPMFQKNKKNKKNLKKYLKYKQVVYILDFNTGKELYRIGEFYDIIYKLKYSEDGKTLFCLHIPHQKMQPNANQRQTWLSTIDAATYSPLRKGFTSAADYEPDFKISQDGNYLGIVSKGPRFLELHVYDFESGRMAYRFEMSYRLFEKKDGEMILPDSRTSFAFLPDGETIVMVMGNHLIYWKFKQ